MRKLFFFLLSGLLLLSCQNSTENAVVDNIMARRSIRQYHDKAVDRALITRIMDCGINAPSGQNKQSWEIRIVDNPVLMNEIKDLLVAGNPSEDPEFIRGCFRGAPVMCFIANDTTYRFSQFDCGMLAQNIMLSATAMGLGSICLGYPVRYMNDSAPCQAVLEKLGFSENFQFCLCVGLGYANESPAARERKKEKYKFID